jgi:hypothetical protein
MVVNKVDENRMRRMAERQGLTLVKSRRRDPLARDYERYILKNDAGDIVAGGTEQHFEFDLSEIEEWLLYPNKR